MKKFLIILIIILFGLTGCIQTGTDDGEIDYITIDLIETEILLLPTPLDESVRESVELITQLVNELSEKEIALIENYDIYINAVNYFKALDEREETRNEIFKELEAYYLNYLPEVVSEDLVFPTKHETQLGDVTITWGSSDYNTISMKGIVTRGRKVTRVTLTITFILENQRYSFTKVVSVMPITFDPLPEKGLSIAYMTVTSNFTEFRPIVRESVDIINYSFASISNGQISVLSLGNLTNLLREREKGTRILFSIGPYGDDFVVPASTAAGREKLANSIVDTIVKYNFDGVDIDWETPDSVTRNNFTALIKEISTKLKAIDKTYLVTAATASASLSGYDFAELNKYLDMYNIMTYDLNARDRVTHNSQLYSSNNTAASYSGHNAITNYINAGADKSKLVLGAAFYGKQYKLASTSGSIIGKTVVATSVSNITYANIKSTFLYRLGNGVTRYWDDDAKMPYLYDANNGTVVVYDDPESVAFKAKYVLDNNLKGLMFWQLNQDSNDDLITAINTNLIKKR